MPLTWCSLQRVTQLVKVNEQIHVQKVVVKTESFEFPVVFFFSKNDLLNILIVHDTELQFFFFFN